MKTTSTKVYIFSAEHGAYWRPEGAGYTTERDDAGVWEKEDAKRITSHCGSEKRIRLIPIRAFESKGNGGPGPFAPRGKTSDGEPS